MNLNFYPNDYTQNPFNQNMYNQSAFNNSYNPYATILGLDNGSGLQSVKKEAENRLQQIQSQISSQALQNQSSQQHQQPYYLFCGNKNDWDEFLLLNYGISEKAIFDDYKLFLQAKQEILEEQGQNKINTLKDKIRNNNGNGINNIDATVKSNIKPNNTTSTVQPTGEFYNNGNNIGDNLGDNSQPNNGLLEPDKNQSKNSNRKK